jgi:hypothetical protein
MSTAARPPRFNPIAGVNPWAAAAAVDRTTYPGVPAAAGVMVAAAAAAGEAAVAVAAVVGAKFERMSSRQGTRL